MSHSWGRGRPSVIKIHERAAPGALEQELVAELAKQEDRRRLGRAERRRRDEALAGPQEALDVRGLDVVQPAIGRGRRLRDDDPARVADQEAHVVETPDGRGRVGESADRALAARRDFHRVLARPEIRRQDDGIGA
jgi:hypothetical protein